MVLIPKQQQKTEKQQQISERGILTMNPSMSYIDRLNLKKIHRSIRCYNQKSIMINEKVWGGTIL